MVYPGLLMTFYLQALWIFPLFGIACCCSTYAKKSPFLLSVVLLFLIMVIEMCVFHYSYVYHFVSQHLSIIGMTHDPFTRLFHGSNDVFFLNKGMPVHPIHSIYNYQSLFFGIVVGFVFLCVAGVRRTRFRKN